MPLTVSEVVQIYNERFRICHVQLLQTRTRVLLSDNRSGIIWQGGAVVTVAQRLLQQIRRGAGLTQRELSELSGTLQPAIARAESGRQDLTVAALERLAHAAGWQLQVVPIQRGSAAQAADACARFIRSNDPDGPYRAVIQLADDLAAEHGAERVALAVVPPTPTGDDRYDAFIAGVVELRLDEESLPHPRWLAGAANLADYWFVDEWSVDDSGVIDRTPGPLRARGVIIDAVELVST
jgi:transcriptional regulator with XRE-family HTH domain